MLTENIKAQIKKFADEKPNEEVCGFMLDNEKIYPCPNDSPTPHNHFKISAADYLKASRIGKIRAVYHSHTETPEFSEYDRLQCDSFNLPFILYFPPNVFKTLDPRGRISDFIGRPFIWDKFNCYSLVADYYKKVKNIQIFNPDKYLKDWFNSFFDDYRAACAVLFNEIPFEKPINLSIIKNEDILAFDCLNVNKPTHFAVYLGGNRILHHPRGEQSLIQEFPEPLKRRLTHILRLK